MAGLQPKTITRGKTFVLNNEYPPAEFHKFVEEAVIEMRIDNGTDRAAFDPGGILATASAMSTHTALANNPHAVTKAQVGLGSVDNTSDANKPVSAATQTALDLKANATTVQSALDLKANDNAVVKLTGNQTVAGVKTFSSSPVVPTLVAGDSSTKAASTAYVDQGLSNLEMLVRQGDITYAGQRTFINSPVVPTPSAGDNSTKAASTAFVSSTVSAAVAPKANDNAVVKLTGNQTVAGVKTFSSSPVVPTPAVENDSTAAANTAWVRQAVAAILEDTMINRGFKTFATNGTWPHPKPGTMLPVLLKAVGGGGGGADTGAGGNGGDTVVSKSGLTVTARGGYGHGVSGSPHQATKGFPVWGAVMGPLGIGIYGGGGGGPSGKVGQCGEALCVAIETDGDLTVAIGAGGTAGTDGQAGQAGFVLIEW